MDYQLTRILLIRHNSHYKIKIIRHFFLKRIESGGFVDVLSG